MRGVAPFEQLWERRTTVTLAPQTSGDDDVIVNIMALEDLVVAKKTQRDKDWPMIRRLVDASYDRERHNAASVATVEFWLAELRSPEFLADIVRRFPEAARTSQRPAVLAALSNGDVARALADEQAAEMAMDRDYWLPLRQELEALRHTARSETE